MTEAETAFAAAEAAIAHVAEAGGTVLFLGGEDFHALEDMPESIAGLSNLEFLSLSNTQVSNLAPIAGLSNLQRLSLSNTQVSNLAPIAGLSNLQRLSLNNTRVNDLAAIAGLSNLRGLTLNSTQVSDLAPLADHPALSEVFFDATPVADLRPLLRVPGLRESDDREIRFEDTVAAQSDSELARLAEIITFKARTDLTLAYLETLPEWPAPLCGTPGDDDPQEQPTKPVARPAPLQVAFVDGQLREVGADTGLAQDAAEREQQGRQALAEYLNDFDPDQLARIENALPRLGKAMALLRAALGAEDAFNPIAAGMQGERVIRLSKGAPERLMDDDGEDVAHFSMQVSLYLDRFLLWQAYKEDATPERVPVEEIAAALPEFATVKGTLDVTDWAMGDVKQSYDVLSEAQKIAEARGSQESAHAIQRESSAQVTEVAKKTLVFASVTSIALSLGLFSGTLPIIIERLETRLTAFFSMLIERLNVFFQ